MKKVLLQIAITDDKIAILINHSGFLDGKYTVPQILETVGVLEHCKQQMLNKIFTRMETA